MQKICVNMWKMIIPVIRNTVERSLKWMKILLIYWLNIGTEFHREFLQSQELSKLIWILSVVLLSCHEYQERFWWIHYVKGETHVSERSCYIFPKRGHLQWYLRFHREISNSQHCPCRVLIPNLKLFLHISILFHFSYVYYTFMKYPFMSILITSIW